MRRYVGKRILCRVLVHLITVDMHFNSFVSCQAAAQQRTESSVTMMDPSLEDHQLQEQDQQQQQHQYGSMVHANDVVFDEHDVVSTHIPRVYRHAPTGYVAPSSSIPSSYTSTGTSKYGSRSPKVSVKSVNNGSQTSRSGGGGVTRNAKKGGGYWSFSDGAVQWVPAKPSLPAEARSPRRRYVNSAPINTNNRNNNGSQTERQSRSAKRSNDNTNHVNGNNNGNGVRLQPVLPHHMPPGGAIMVGNTSADGNAVARGQSFGFVNLRKGRTNLGLVVPPGALPVFDWSSTATTAATSQPTVATSVTTSNDYGTATNNGTTANVYINDTISSIVSTTTAMASSLESVTPTHAHATPSSGASVSIPWSAQRASVVESLAVGSAARASHGLTPRTLRDRHNVRRAAVDEPLNRFVATSSPFPPNQAQHHQYGGLHSADRARSRSGRNDTYESEWYAHSIKPIPQRFIVASRERYAEQHPSTTPSSPLRPVHGSTVPHALKHVALHAQRHTPHCHHTGHHHTINGVSKSSPLCLLPFLSIAGGSINNPSF
jgi:hypothetical protein